ncbi:secretion protein HlyD [Massilia sp. WF1]|uniref:efflux RND transporter periplasmic adaptor subunit n=1 Tax=unclassified Massilia TaxID=2609279 RepID=UPI00064B75B6|nr:MULTISPECIES: efflux RND transporter periplasmic adaptor subunit [unclassified Massilia]ALK96443.1 efflux transporter periplasmic adaptor subunit [Massilia sp. WG5]KLU37803.1 secretion protein HlyD [Massilia sp. WF1]
MLRKTLLVLAIASALAACGKSKEPAKPATATAQAGAAKDGKAVQLLVSSEDVLTVQSNALASGPVITGSIQPERKADLRAEVSAVVLQVLKENGEPVKRGDVLVKLDETSIRDSLMSAEASARAADQAFDQSTRALERLKTLRASGMASAQALDDAEVRRNSAQSEVSAARARLVAARQQVGRTVVRAPFDGIVSDRKVSAGDTAAIGKELLKVIDPTSMRFEGRVSADKIAAVKVGQPVMFRINGYGEQQFAGIVRRIDPAANDVTRQVEVLVGFQGAAQPRVAGLYAEGRIDAEVSDALTLPEAALVKAGDKTFAWKVKGNALAKADLAVGARDPRTGNFEIKGGLAVGDTVLRHPSANLKDGQKVELAAARVASAGNGEAQGK